MATLSKVKLELLHGSLERDPFLTGVYIGSFQPLGLRRPAEYNVANIADALSEISAYQEELVGAKAWPRFFQGWSAAFANSLDYATDPKIEDERRRMIEDTFDFFDVPLTQDLQNMTVRIGRNIMGDEFREFQRGMRIFSHPKPRSDDLSFNPYSEYSGTILKNSIQMPIDNAMAGALVVISDEGIRRVSAAFTLAYVGMTREYDCS